MSHLITIQTQVRDSVAIASACSRLRLPPPAHRTVKLFASAETGWAVELPEWRYPIVCQTDSGELKYDNFGSRWGDQSHLDRFVQAYAVEMVKLQARRQGQTAIEQPMADGSIRVQIAVAG
ncbi:hypothetical protein [Schlesneria paludicola]|uniref:hypothetical protein n=1 Tax=Schlesneria paludicola TaxID=360056 RepID=UPI00029B1802|nr:hypothetical protein [Schlesneria paludicola]